MVVSGFSAVVKCFRRRVIIFLCIAFFMTRKRHLELIKLGFFYFKMKLFIEFENFWIKMIAAVESFD